MITNDKKGNRADEKEKEWDNPQAPEQTSDERDKEQIIRQFKEAKRRHDNLTEPDNNESKKDTKNI